MRNLGIVQGSKEQAVSLIVGKDTVYVHTDIELLPPDEEQVESAENYQYNEIQYDKDEYIKLMSEQNSEMENLVNTMLGVN
jgi:hypothetical protein